MTEFYLNVFLGLLILGLPLLFMYLWPKTINNLSGYRTRRSMNSQDSWDYAQKYWPKSLSTMSFAVIALQIILCFTIDVVVALLITMFIWILSLFVSIFLTEQELKRKFDEKK